VKRRLVLALLGVGVVMLWALEAFAVDDNGANGRLKGTFSFHLRPATSFAPFYDGTAGKPNSGVATAPRQDILRVGVFTANGAGDLTGHAIATTDDGSTTLIIDFTFSGTFTVNADGTGTASVSPVTINSCVTGDGTSLPVTTCSGLEGSETYAFVLNGLGDDKAVSFIQTDNAGGGAKIFLTGEARRR